MAGSFRELFLCDFEVNGSITKKIGTSDFSGADFYSAQIMSPPNFDLSGEGYVSGSFGSIRIVNDPTSTDAVFNYADGTWPPENKPYPISFQWGEQAQFLFEGEAVIRAIDDVSITLDLVAPQYSNELLDLQQTDTRVIVDSVRQGAGNLVEVTATNHGLETSNEVIFEGLTTSSLDYNASTNADPYEITVIDSSTFTLNNTDASGDHGLSGTSTGEGSGFVGIPVFRPMAFGFVTHRVPLAKSSTILANPNLDHTKVIRVYEDGVLIGVGKSTTTQTNVTAVTAATTTTYTVASHEFRIGDSITPASFDDVQYHVAQNVIAVTSTTVVTDLNSTGFSTDFPGNINFTSNIFVTNPTPSEITLNNSVSGGELSVTGTSAIASTVLDVLTYTTTQLSLTLDTSNAGSASTTNVAFYIENQKTILDMAADVAKTFKYQFYISNGTLYLIDMFNVPSSTTVEADLDVISVSYNMPVDQFESEWTLRVPFSGTAKRLGSVLKRTAVPSSTFAGVNDRISVEALVESEQAQKANLKRFLTIHERPILSLSTASVNFDISVGDLLTFKDQNKLLECTLNVRSISYNFDSEQTEFTGDGSVGILVRE